MVASFLCLRNGIRGYPVLSCLSVCYPVTLAKKINLGHNFWTVRDKDFIFGMHTQLIKPFQMTPKYITLTATFILKLANIGLCCRWGHSCFTNTPFFNSYCPLSKIRLSDHVWPCFVMSWWNLVSRFSSTKKKRDSLNNFWRYCPLFKSSLCWGNFFVMPWQIKLLKLVASFPARSYLSSCFVCSRSVRLQL